MRMEVFGAVTRGIQQGLCQAGLSGAMFELTAALWIALDTPDAGERYLAKKPVFERARVAIRHRGATTSFVPASPPA